MVEIRGICYRLDEGRVFCVLFGGQGQVGGGGGDLGFIVIIGIRDKLSDVKEILNFYMSYGREERRVRKGKLVLLWCFLICFIRGVLYKLRLKK